MANSNDSYYMTTRIHRRNVKEKIDFIDINVSGIEYRILKNTVRKNPGSMLASLSYIRGNKGREIYEDDLPEGVKWDPDKQHFIVIRSPRLFDSVILQCHTNGNLHIPKDVCKEEVAEELAFWNLTSFHHVCKKCVGKRHCEEEDGEDDDEEEEEEDGDKLLNVKRRMTFYSTMSRWSAMKRYLRHFLQRPKSSHFAMLYAAFCVITIVVSIANFALGTVNELQHCPENDTNSTKNSSTPGGSEKPDDIPTSPYDFFDVSGNSFFSPCQGTKIFQIVDLCCIFAFTLDFVLRLAASREIFKFVTSLLHVTEFIVLIPYYIEIILWIITVDIDNKHTIVVLRVLRIMQSLRLLVIFKLARYFENLKIFAATVRYSKKEFLMLLIFIIIVVASSSAFVYELENLDDPNSPFSNILISFWWGIATISTVGYGDLIPASIGGRIIAACTCIMGMLCMAFPTSVLVENFRKAYRKNKKNKNFIKFEAVTKHKRKTRAEDDFKKRRRSSIGFSKD